VNNFLLLAANRIAHFKVVVVAVVCATLVAAIGLAARVTDFGTADGRQEATVLKAGKSVTSSSETRTIR
jgi:signal transduction histidine kinase